MSDYQFFLTSANYTWGNALTWRYFTEHCKRANQGTFYTRAVHILIASVELLPVISQIASIFEKCAFDYFADDSSDAPKTAYPLLNRVENDVNSSSDQSEAVEKDANFSDQSEAVEKDANFSDQSEAVEKDADDEGSFLACESSSSDDETFFDCQSCSSEDDTSFSSESSSSADESIADLQRKGGDFERLQLSERELKFYNTLTAGEQEFYNMICAIDTKGGKSFSCIADIALILTRGNHPTGKFDQSTNILTVITEKKREGGVPTEWWLPDIFFMTLSETIRLRYQAEDSTWEIVEGIEMLLGITLRAVQHNEKNEIRGDVNFSLRGWIPQWVLDKLLNFVDIDNIFKLTQTLKFR